MKKYLMSISLSLVLALTSVPLAFADSSNSAPGDVSTQSSISPMSNETFTTAAVDEDDVEDYSYWIYGQNQYGRFTLQGLDGGGGLTAYLEESVDGGDWNTIAILNVNVTLEPTASANVWMARNAKYRIKLTYEGLSGKAYLRSYDY